MRFDSIGMFWEDRPVKRGESASRVMPEIPDTGWTPPKDFPNLSKAKAIALDCETYDPGLRDYGPGWARGEGHIVGVSIGVEGGHRWYFPIRHTIEPEYNLDPQNVIKWLAETLSDPKQIKIGANLIYDIGWLRQEGVYVKGQLFDVQNAEALLDESAPVALEILGQKYLNEGKETNHLYRWCADYYGGKVNGRQRENIYRAPPRLVGPYAESDADLPLRIANVVYPLLVRENLLDVFNLESRLTWLLIDTRFEGVRVDTEKAETLRDKLKEKENNEQQKINEITGTHVDINSGDSLKKAFDKLGLSYPLTAKGNPSFTKDVLAGIDHPITQAISEKRKYEKLGGTFLQAYILDSHVDGRLYGQFHQLRGEGGGTRSGRLSSSNPNLQNIPARDEDLAPLIRGLFVPDEGHESWVKFDYSQIEYRLLVHYAVGDGSDRAREIYRANPDMDYHQFVTDMVKEYTGTELDRVSAKGINFGLCYGMGESKLARTLNLSKAESHELFNSFHTALPYARMTMDSCIEYSKRNGYIDTFLGRKSRFNLWEPENNRNFLPATNYDDALLNYGNIERAFTYKALNRLLQGSAADLMKKAMVDCYESGVFDYTGVPRLTVHDELDFSNPGDCPEAFREVKHIMETCLDLKVPVKADYEIGPDWGHTSKVE